MHRMGIEWRRMLFLGWGESRRRREKWRKKNRRGRQWAHDDDVLIITKIYPGEHHHHHHLHRLGLLLMRAAVRVRFISAHHNNIVHVNGSEPNECGSIMESTQIQRRSAKPHHNRPIWRRRWKHRPDLTQWLLPTTESNRFICFLAVVCRPKGLFARWASGSYPANPCGQSIHNKRSCPCTNNYIHVRRPHNQKIISRERNNIIMMYRVVHE